MLASVLNFERCFVPLTAQRYVVYFACASISNKNKSKKETFFLDTTQNTDNQ